MSATVTQTTVGRGFLALALVVLAGGLEASTVRRLTLDEMAVHADQIFTGRVVGIASQLNARRTGIHTFVTIEVDEYLKGGRRNLLTLRFLGGDALGRELTADDVTGASVLYPGATAPTGSIHGVVRRASGEAVRYAHVVAYEPVLDHTVGGWANGEGRYEIAGLPDGRYVLRVNPIYEGHTATAYFFPFGQADTDFSVTVHPRLVAVSEGGTTEVSLEVTQ